jgi:His/Glu/Gln/Arg/opine family amino acid ABC transporter permease subunit
MSFSMICIQLLKGLGSTCLIFALTLLLSLPLGLLVCFGRMSRFKPLQYVVRFFISILRGTPLMLQLIVVCFAPYYVFGMKLTAGWTFAALIIGFVINYAAYFAEIYRGGIESIPVGQYEAAEVLGYTRGQTFGRIILPQMVKRVLPPVTNEVITLVKDTSLAFVLSYAEMFTIAKRVANSISSVMPLFVAGLFYFVFNAIVAWAMEKIEKRMSYYH